MTDFMDSLFNTSGVIPTQSKFWQQSVDRFVSGDGITPAFSKVIGEQVFKPTKKAITPFYNAFVGRPIKYGSGFTERAICKKVMKEFKPKATASDDLSFYDSEGIEKTYEIDVKGWLPVSLPSELESIEMFVKDNGVANLNNLLVENVREDYLRAIESEIEKKVISCTKTEIEIDLTDLDEVYNSIVDYACDMRGDETHYNELTSTENGKIYTSSDEVLCFIQEKLYNKIKNSRATMPSPNQLVENVKFILMPNKLPTPITTAEITAGVSSGKWTSGISPAGVDGKQPFIYLCSSNKCEYRPVIGSYKVNLKRNGAGDFVNEHLIYKGCIAVRPWENAIKFVEPDPEEDENVIQ